MELIENTENALDCKADPNVQFVKEVKYQESDGVGIAEFFRIRSKQTSSNTSGDNSNHSQSR